MTVSILTRTGILAILSAGWFVLPAPASEPSDSVSSNQEVASVTSTQDVSVAPAPQMVGEPELKNLLTGVLQRDYVRDLGELDLALGRSWTPLAVSNAPVTMKVTEVPTVGVTQDFIVRFDLIDNSNQKLGSWQMPVTAHIWREVWVAHSDLRRGELFTGTDCIRERRDLLICRQAYLGNADPSTQEIAENVSSGAVILERQVRPRTVVRRGQVAQAFVRDGVLAITLKVEVLEDGALGQQVRVRNPQSNREFRGKVENEGSISVSL
jgi:flagella basal body P-ring formation protein FlgA